MSARSLKVLGLLLALGLASLFLFPALLPLANAPSERLTNGSFEEGFAPDGVGLGWTKFHNGGEADYSWHDDSWAPVVWDGQHAQLIEINTFSRGGSDPDRYAGICQTVVVVAGASYEFSLHGMMRALEWDTDPESYGYRVQWGYDPAGSGDWQAITNWTDVGWNEVYPRTAPGAMKSFSTSFVAPSDRITLCIRGWKKWGSVSREFLVDLDGISLTGAMPADVTPPTVAFTVPPFPMVGKTSTIHVTASNDVGVTKLTFRDTTDGTSAVIMEHAVGVLSAEKDALWTPATAGLHTLEVVAEDAAGGITTASQTVTVGDVAEYLINGNFEGGFGPDGVGLGWTGFHNGGEADYGWYDDTWAPVVYDGLHSQLLEINTFCRGGSDPDRYIGICQNVSGLTVGATYEISMHGMIRAMAGDPDMSNFSYRVQWGYDPAASGNWQVITNWVEVSWDTGYPRTAPGAMQSYSASFTAPSNTITLCIRAWKKWGTAGRELDVNLDGISLKGYQ
ncbi:MAG: hypothetical protein ACE5NP_06930 [Anaerolineae bacterium]